MNKCGILIQYYLAIQRTEIQTHVTTWVNFENILLSERNKLKKKPYIVWFHLYETSRIGKSIENNDCQRLKGMEDLGVTAKECRVSLWEKVMMS